MSMLDACTVHEGSEGLHHSVDAVSVGLHLISRGQSEETHGH